MKEKRIIFLSLFLMLASLYTIFRLDVETNASLPYLFSHQLVWFCIGWGAFFVMSLVPLSFFQKNALVLYLLFLFLLVFVLLTPAIQGVHRWFRIFGFSFQPSEYAKITTAFLLARFLSENKRKIYSFKTSFKAFFLCLLPALLVWKEPDMGTALIYIFTGVMALYLAQGNRVLFTLLFSSILVAFSLVGMIFTGLIPHEEMRPYALKVMKEYQFERLNPNTYHQKAAIAAIGLGGALGNQGEITYTKGGWLPAALTDSIYSALSEEVGLLGSSWILLAYFMLVYVGFEIGSTTHDPFLQMLAYILTGFFAFHVVVNMGMMTGLLPITGIPLPLLSYGGSSLLSGFSMLGLLQNIHRNRYNFFNQTTSLIYGRKTTTKSRAL